MTKELVESDWIRLFDSVEPLKEKLHNIKNKAGFSKKEYGCTIEEIEYCRKYRKTERAKQLNRKYYLNRKQRYIENGLCVLCGIRPLKSKTMCEFCLNRQKKHKDKRR